MDDIQKLKQDAGIINEGELNGTVSDFSSLVDDIKLAMSQGQTIQLTAKEAHISDRYKGEIYEYTIKVLN